MGEAGGEREREKSSKKTQTQMRGTFGLGKRLSLPCVLCTIHWIYIYIYIYI